MMEVNTYLNHGLDDVSMQNRVNYVGFKRMLYGFAASLWDGSNYYV